MFQKLSKTDSNEGGSINLIGSGTAIVGDITSNGDVRIDGTLKGNITITGKLVVGSTGKVEGNVYCQNADVSGEIHGTVSSTDLLTLKATAKVMGDIVTGKIAIEPNATFTGTCKMGAIVKNITNDTQTRETKTA